MVDQNGAAGITILFNGGDGGFATSTQYVVGLWPRGVAVDDFDGDMQADLAVANGGSHDVAVLLETVRPGSPSLSSMDCVPTSTSLTSPHISWRSATRTVTLSRISPW